MGDRTRSSGQAAGLPDRVHQGSSLWQPPSAGASLLSPAPHQPHKAVGQAVLVRPEEGRSCHDAQTVLRNAGGRFLRIGPPSLDSEDFSNGNCRYL